MKKNIIYLIAAILGVTGFASCDQTDNEPMVGTFTPPEVTIPADGKGYVLTEAGQDNLVEVMEWVHADFGFPAAVTYTVQMTAVDGDFSVPYELVTSNEDQVRLTVKDLNDAAIEFIEPDEPGNLWIRLKADLHNDVDVLYSDTLTISVVPFESVKVIEPLFIVGDVLGSDYVWNNNNYTYIVFRDSSDPNVFDYNYTGFFNAGGFKLLPELGNWDRQFGMVDGSIAKDDGGSGNISIETEGYYTLNINTDEVTFSIEESEATKTDATYDMIGLIGAFNEWGGDLELTQESYDPHIWTADDVELPEGELKFRANGGWDANWGGTSFPYGAGVSGGDNIVVPEGTYFVKFNDITKHYVFYKKGE
jgi:hypothetical protein